MSLNYFLSINYSKLQAGEHIALPLWVNNLTQLGFKEVFISQPAGQIKDYVLSLKNGSRLHVHEFQDGSRKVHLDKHDPDKNAESLWKHLLEETWIAPALLAVFGLIILSKLSK